MHFLSIIQVLFLVSSTGLAAPQPRKGNVFSKRALPPLDIFPGDKTSQDHKSALAEALSDTLRLVQQVSLSYPGDDGSGPYKDIWSKYFPDSDHKAVQGVWNKIISDPNNPGQGEDIVKTAVIVGTDLLKQQLRVEVCVDGVEAYTNPFPADFDPGLPNTATFTYFCDEAFKQPLRYGDISCSTVGDTLSSKMEFLGGTILHEWMHNDGIGAQGTGGKHIGDFSTPEDEKAGYGPYKTRQLLKDNPGQCIVNADSFLYLAYEILWTKMCLSGDTRFKDPAVDTNKVTGIPAAPAATITSKFTNEAPVSATLAPFSTAGGSTAPAPTCFHAADPDGARGLCPDLANNGWCDCGEAGDYSMLSGTNICGYTSLPTSASIVLSSTNCAASTTVPVVTVTVVPVPVPSSSKFLLGKGFGGSGHVI